MNLYVPPGAIVPLSNACPSSLVMVWGADDMFFQITVVPGVIVSDAGLKTKAPLLSLRMSTTCVEPLAGFGCGVGVAMLAVGVSVMVVGVVAEDTFAVVVDVVAGLVLALLPPHAASNTMRSAATTNR